MSVGDILGRNIRGTGFPRTKCLADTLQSRQSFLRHQNGGVAAKQELDDVPHGCETEPVDQRDVRSINRGAIRFIVDLRNAVEQPVTVSVWPDAQPDS